MQFAMNAREALAAARSGQTKAAQDACLTALDDPAAPVEQWSAVLVEILNSSKSDADEELGWMALDALEARLEPREVLPHARRVLRFFSKSTEMRNRAIEMYRKAFDGVEGFEQLLDLSGLAGGKPIRRAMQTLDICLFIQPGSYLLHKDDGPPARVLSIDPESWSVRLETPGGQELVDPVSLGDHYEPAEAHDFRVLSQFDRQTFQHRLENDPDDIVLTILKAHGNRMTSDELEAALSPRHIASGAWSKWWSKVRTGLRRNPRIRMEGRSPVTIIYEASDVAIEQAVWARFDPHQAPKAWLDLAQEYGRECRDKGLEVKTEFLQRLRDAVRVEALALVARKESPALAAWLTCGELNRMLGEAPDHEAVLRVMTGFGAFSAAISALPNDSYTALALAAVRERRPQDWPRDFAELLPYLSPALSDDVVEQIKSAGHAALLADLPQKILSDPVAHASGLCWLFQGPKDAALFEVPPLITLLTRLLSTLEQLHGQPVEFAREVKARARAVFTARKFARFQACLEQIDAGMASALRTQIQRSTGLTEAVIQDLISKLRLRFPQLWAQPRRRRWEDDSILYCTSEGRRRREAELHELVHVKMKENARAIGEAAAHGDLSENSEYKFALEERDLLRARVAEIQSQLSRAQILNPEEVPVEHVGIGSRVLLESASDGAPLTLTFLGPWEADVEQRVLNYQAPLSRSVMGRTVGDAVDIDLGDTHGTYRITAIEAGI
jgi:transcription elongation GreA/GreB family factor